MLKSLFICLIAFVLLTISSFSLKAQDSKIGTWGIITVLMPGDTVHKWGGYTELQTRTKRSI
ncbi:MAG: hypothetical protein JWR76_2257 [Mucilaginibacter sp.]|nr:hypothetical protein [Mucilaginibacter sp.]